MSIPYETATSGASAREETTKLLRRIGCDEIGFMENFKERSLLLEFGHRGQRYRFVASATGWAAWMLRDTPYTSRMRRSKVEYEAHALAQGMIAVSSILRDWVKGQVTAIECGIMPVQEAFLAQSVTTDGRRLIERIGETKLMLAPPSGGA